MTFVSTASTEGDTYTSPTLVAGDVVVLVVGGDAAGGAIPTPTGWMSASEQMRLSLPSGGAASGSATTVGATFWRRATGTSVTAAFPRRLRIQSLVLRDVTALSGLSARRVNAADLTYPDLAFEDPMTGHAVHVGIAVNAFTVGPAAVGDTVRQSDQVSAGGVRNAAGQPVLRRSWLTTTEKAFTAATSVPAVSSGQRVDGWALTLAFATVSGPPAPSILAPAAGSVDLAAGFTLRWAPSGAQTGYAIRRRLTSGPGAWAWWTGTDWAATSETITSGTATSLAVPAAQFANGATSYDVEVATVGDVLRPSLGTYGRVVVVGKAPPTLASATVSPLSGSTLTSLTPSVALSGSAGSGGVMSGYRVRVDQDLGAGWVQVLDSGLRPTSPWTVSVAQASSLSNGRPIRFRSVAVQDGTQESPVLTSATYTLNAPTPAAPTVAVAPLEHLISGLPGVEVTVTSAPLGTPYLAHVYRDGVLVGAYPTTGVVVLSDYFAPSAGAVQYTATVTSGDGVATVRTVSPTSVPATATIDNRAMHCWLSDPLDPSTAVRAHLTEDSGLTYALNASVYRPIGQRVALTHHMPMSAPDGSLTVQVYNPTDADRVVALLGSGKRLLFRGHVETDTLTREQLAPRDLMFRAHGAAEVSRPHRGPHGLRHVAFSWVSAADEDAPLFEDEELIFDGGAP